MCRFTITPHLPPARRSELGVFAWLVPRLLAARPLRAASHGSLQVHVFDPHQRTNEQESWMLRETQVYQVPHTHRCRSTRFLGYRSSDSMEVAQSRGGSRQQGKPVSTHKGHTAKHGGSTRAQARAAEKTKVAAARQVSHGLGSRK